MIRNALVNVGKVATVGLVTVGTTDISSTDKSSSSTVSSTYSAASSSDSFIGSVYKEIDLSKYPSLEHHMLHSSFRGDGKLEDYRLFLNDKVSSLIAISRFGARACGHPTTIHGGALAAILDDTMGSLFLASRVGHGYTANLNIDYRKPVTAGTNLRVQADFERIETARSGSKKVYIKAIITNEDQSLLFTEAKALFITKPKPSDVAGMLETKSSENKAQDPTEDLETGNSEDTDNNRSRITSKVTTTITTSNVHNTMEQSSIDHPEKIPRMESK